LDKPQFCLSRAGGNPAILFKMHFYFVPAWQVALFIDWIPACAGMTGV
jgi:hypothetical protein